MEIPPTQINITQSTKITAFTARTGPRYHHHHTTTTTAAATTTINDKRHNLFGDHQSVHWQCSDVITGLQAKAQLLC
jgi:hypothetical protein